MVFVQSPEQESAQSQGHWEAWVHIPDRVVKKSKFSERRTRGKRKEEEGSVYDGRNSTLLSDK